MPLKTHLVTYQFSRAEAPQAAIDLVDVTCEPDPRHGPAHHLLVPVGWQPIWELPVDPAPDALKICSLFLEAPTAGDRGAVVMVASREAGAGEPEVLIQRLAGSEGLDVEEVHREREGDIRALCKSTERVSVIRMLRDGDRWLILTATAPAERFDEVNEAFHYALISLEPVHPP